jgi:drug/metabolite transporter (DMT)-like permease
MLVTAPFIFRSPPADGFSWGILAILGVVQLGLPYVLYAWAIKRVTALEAIMIPIVEPILNPIWVGLFIGEMPGKWAIPGGIIVICAAVACASIRVIRTKIAPKSPQTN